MATDNTEIPSKSDKPGIVVVDIGKKQKGKDIRRLRRGEGKLMDKVQSLVEEIQENLDSGAQVQPIVLVVRRKRKRTWNW